MSGGQDRGITQEQLNNWFTYHKPSETDAILHEMIEGAAHRFASVIVANTPSSADQTAAIRKVREAMMTASAAIACGGR